jgi:hypothetical protein
MTRLFNRKNNKTTIAELEEYYANENQRKTRTGAAWFMALLSLLITIAVIVALFFAGRWIYRAVTNNDADSPSTTSDVNGSNPSLPSYDGDINAGSSASNGAADTNTDTPGTSTGADSTNSSSTSQTGGTVSDEAASTTESNADRIAAAGPTTSEIPDTGAGESIVFILSGTTAIGYFVSRKFHLRKNVQ